MSWTNDLPKWKTNRYRNARPRRIDIYVVVQRNLIQDVTMLVDAARFVAIEMAALPSVKKISIIGALAKKAKKEGWMLAGQATAEELAAGIEKLSQENLDALQTRDSRKKRHSVMDDLELAIWVDPLDTMNDLRVTLLRGLKEFIASGRYGVSNNEFDVIVLDANNSKYLGHLCLFATCPRGFESCDVTGCGSVQFQRRFWDYTHSPDVVNAVNRLDVWERPGVGSIDAEFNLETMLAGERKESLVKLIARLFKLGGSAKKTILAWLTKQGHEFEC
jgi:hypothetical protein